MATTKETLDKYLADRKQGKYIADRNSTRGVLDAYLAILVNTCIIPPILYFSRNLSMTLAFLSFSSLK